MNTPDSKYVEAMNCRIGYGYDVHRLAAGGKLYLGGVLVSEEIGAVAHSDGDVLLHAMCDAMLGAAALGDIGIHFPDSDAAFKDIRSLELLERTFLLVGNKGFSLVNADATIILERPKIMAYAPDMRRNIASRLRVEPDRISIKATTSEGMGFIGSGEGIAAHAVVLLKEKN